MDAHKIQLRKRKDVNYYEPEIPSLDAVTIADRCYLDDSFPVHECYDHVRDKEVIPTSPIPRAIQSLPSFLEIKPSSIPGAGLGVFTKVKIRANKTFGPYGGIKRNINTKIKSNYSWQIYKDGRQIYKIDGANKHKSNWLRYINCARNINEQNLQAYQNDGHVYYRNLRTIPRNEELLVFYGREYAVKLGINMTTYYQNYDKGTRTQVANDEFICDFCGFISSRKHSLELHIRKHLGVKPYRCHICDHQCTRLYYLKLHLAKHKNNKRFKCNLCNFRTTRLFILNSHKLTHTKEKPFQCHRCDYKTSQSGTLQRHVRAKHTDSEPFRCNECEFKSPYKCSLQRHILTQHIG